MGEAVETVHFSERCDGVEHGVGALKAEEGMNESGLQVVPKTED